MVASAQARLLFTIGLSISKKKFCKKRPPLGGQRKIKIKEN